MEMHSEHKDYDSPTLLNTTSDYRIKDVIPISPSSSSVDIRIERNRKARAAYAAMNAEKKTRLLARRRANYARRIEGLRHNTIGIHDTCSSSEATSLSLESPVSVDLGTFANSDCNPSTMADTFAHVGVLDHNLFSSAPLSTNDPRFQRLLQLNNEPWLLPEVVACSFCDAEKFYREPPSFCCSSGQVSLAPTTMHPLLRDLFLNDKSSISCEFKRRARSYNNAFAFTSLGMKTDRNYCWANEGVYAVRVVGQVFHFLSDPSKQNTKARNLQLFFYESIDEVDANLLHESDLSAEVVKILIEVTKHNPYSQFFRSLYINNNLNNYHIIIRSDPSLDQRIFNLPTVSQVAAIWSECDDVPEDCARDIRVYVNGGQSHKVNYYYGCYDPLQYPLLFSFGEPGWHMGIQRRTLSNTCGNKRKAYCLGQNFVTPNAYHSADLLLQDEEENMQCNKKKRGNISCREYYCYKTQIRANDGSCILHAGRLGQQYIIDMYIKLETSRLDYYRSEQQQSNARTESYQGIVDSLAIHGENNPNKIGRRIILPASFIGGPRDMRKRYINAIALVQRFGKPDLFLTMTCNPQWPEIAKRLSPGEKSHDRPDLVSRVFRAKVEELKHEIVKKNLFGKVAAYVYVIEYQKRGLPHVHFLIILKQKYKIVSSQLYDYFISAEIPDIIIHPLLHSYVLKHMMHGPCGNANPKNVCMTDGKCKNQYPKSFCQITTHNKNSYPCYRRRDSGHSVIVRRTQLDNRWVVPYNPYLLAKFNCHLNVEICADIKLVKYLYKYIYKGHDRVAFHIVEQANSTTYDEIKEFQNARWVSAPEAYWRIFGFTMSEMHPPVIVLHVHLENEHFVSFGKQKTIEQILSNPMLSKTMLTEFFWMNEHNADARRLNLLYVEFPEHFVWIPKYKMWQLRARQTVIGRLVTVSPAEGDRYFLRILLMHVRCPTSFSFLMSINGKRAGTFRHAAVQRGLLQSDDYIEQCLEEAVEYQMPYSLRRLFAVLLVYCAPADPGFLWDKYFPALSEDFSFSNKLTELQLKQNTLASIDAILLPMGKSVNDFCLAIPSLIVSGINNNDKDFEHEKSIVVSDEDLLSIRKLNAGKKEAFHIVTRKVYSGGGGAYFIDGPGGTGKTYLYRAILAYVRSKGDIALAVATSGVAASLLPGGRTAHSRFKLPLDFDDRAQCKIGKQSSLAKMILIAKIIIWDEASMSNRKTVEAFDKLLQDLTDSELTFGGKVVLFGGDFRQTLPIVVHGSKEDMIEASLVNSKIWSKITSLQLVENMRAHSDPDFIDFLLRIGNGTEPNVFDGNVHIPSKIFIPFADPIQSLDALIKFVFPSLDSYSTNPYSMVNRAILTPKNDSVHDLNELLIQRFSGQTIEYLSCDETVDPSQQAEYEDYINSVQINGLPPHKLILKQNSPIMLLRNLNPVEGLCNGTRLICCQLGKTFISAEIAFGEFRGKHVFIPRIPLEPSDKLKCPIPFRRTQFPVRLCFAMTINKAQGQTLDSVGIYLPDPVFSHGQLYVALSRARTSDSIRVLIQPPIETNECIQYTKNIVYKEVFTLVTHGKW